MSKKQEELDNYPTLIMFNLADFKNAENGQGIKGVTIKLNGEVDIPPVEGEEKSRAKKTKYGAESEHIPHDDFIKAMIALRDEALEAIDLGITASGKNDFTVYGIKLNGNINLNQAHVSFLLVKKVYRSESLYKMPPTPEILLNDGGNFLAWKGVKKKVMALIEQAYLYIGGKHNDDKTPLAFQLKLDLSVTPEEESKSEVKEKKQSRKKIEPVILPEDIMTGPVAQA